ncbi:hypothetical protein [Actinoplanes solisilvae]|uniref:hypothetical protein n=1 Tax=Actinoplanes solisilvae TaxID=2486853 RepID=UPI00196ACA91|nr:hypothetical protein [Actinoplanes solisilvae]
MDDQDDARRIGARDRTIGEDFAVEQPLLVRLPDDDFETGMWLAPRVEPLQPTHRPHEPLLSAGAAGRPAGPRSAARLPPGRQ